MARQPTGNPNGRPPKEFNQKLFENLCHIQCTVSEITSVLNADIKTIDSWCERTYGESYSLTYKRFAEGGKASLRRTQFQLAQKNASMSIWLGKNMLDQKDANEEERSKRFVGALERIAELKIAGDNGANGNNTNPVSKAGEQPVSAETPL